jgi:haloalkane dehalogenase
MIGMAFAARHPDRVKRLVLLNTAAFHLPQTRSFHWQLKIARDTRFGAFLVRRFNAFSWIASKVCVKRKKLSPEIKAGYLAPYDNWDNRIATLRFVQDIPLEPKDPGYDIISGVEEALPSFNEKPVLVCWGEQDFVFDLHFLAKWRRLLPDAEVHSFPDCGHYILEDATEEITTLVRSFLESNPL